MAIDLGASTSYERAASRFVFTFLNQNVDDVIVLVNSTPEITAFPLDRDDHRLIPKPRVPQSALAFAKLVAGRMMGPVSVTRLAEMTVMDRTTLTRNLELLRKQGLIEVVPGEDRRTRIVTITPRGNAALAEAMPFWKKAQSHVVKALGQERWTAMQTDLGEMVALAHVQ